MSTNKIGQVLSCAPGAIIVELDNLKSFDENQKEHLQIGRFLKIAQGNRDYTIAVINNIKGTKTIESETGDPIWTFLIECQAIGTLVGDKYFERGSVLLPVPTEPVFIVEKDTLDKLFVNNDKYNFPFGNISSNRDVDLMIDGDNFFSKHIAIVGSTGSGKSCAVAKILHDIVGISGEQEYIKKEKQNNSHVVIFDIHSEYEAAFRLVDEQKYTLNNLNIDNLKLPYWLLKSEELESMFIESSERESHNQISQFKFQCVLQFLFLDIFKNIFVLIGSNVYIVIRLVKFVIRIFNQLNTQCG